MGVDNNGVLVVGLESGEFPYPDGYEGNINDWYWDHRGEVHIPDGMDLRDINPGYWECDIAGIVVADSGSYAYKKVEDIEDRIGAAKAAFKTVFGVDGKVFILNNQW